MSNSGDNWRRLRVNRRWLKLFELAEASGILDILGRQVAGQDPASWGGYWRADPEYGAALIVNRDLSELEAQWTYAHELGHEYTHRQYFLFKQEAFASTKSTRNKGWQKPRSNKAHEEAASEWAARRLVTPGEWWLAESKHPCCLRQMAAFLDLHPLALLWAGKCYTLATGDWSGTACLSPASLAELHKRNERGGGGHQALLGMLLDGLQGTKLTITRKGFNRLREYAVNAKGGYGKRYRLCLGDLQAAMQAEGGIWQFFRRKSRPQSQISTRLVGEQLLLGSDGQFR